MRLRCDGYAALLRSFIRPVFCVRATVMPSAPWPPLQAGLLTSQPVGVGEVLLAPTRSYGGGAGAASSAGAILDSYTLNRLNGVLKGPQIGWRRVESAHLPCNDPI